MGLFARGDSTAGAGICAGAAVETQIGVDGVDLTLADSAGGALVDASAASHAVIADYVSHSVC